MGEGERLGDSLCQAILHGMDAVIQQHISAVMQLTKQIYSPKRFIRAENQIVIKIMN